MSLGNISELSDARVERRTCVRRTGRVPVDENSLRLSECHAAPICRKVVSVKLVKDLIQRFCGGEPAENHEGQVIVD